MIQLQNLLVLVLVQGSGFRLSGYRAQGLRFGVWSFGIQSSGFEVLDVGLRVDGSGSGFRIQGSGFSVQG